MHTLTAGRLCISHRRVAALWNSFISKDASPIVQPCRSSENSIQLWIAYWILVNRAQSLWVSITWERMQRAVFKESLIFPWDLNWAIAKLTEDLHKNGYLQWKTPVPYETERSVVNGKSVMYYLQHSCVECPFQRQQRSSLLTTPSSPQKNKSDQM